MFDILLSNSKHVITIKQVCQYIAYSTEWRRLVFHSGNTVHCCLKVRCHYLFFLYKCIILFS